MKRIITILLAAISVVGLSAAILPATGNYLEDLIATLEGYVSKRPQEKVFLHTDREHYVAGDAIWLAAYVTNATGAPTRGMSEIVYADLINQQGEVIDTRRMAIDNGQGNAYFELPKNLASGAYYLRGYTRWMRNFDTKVWFQKPLRIYNLTNSSGANNEPAASRALSVRFYPEAGTWVQNVASKVVIRSTVNGQPVAVSGVIVNQAQDTISSISTNDKGLGTELLQPRSTDTLTALVSVNNTTPQAFALPAAKAEGMAFGVTETLNSYQINIKGSSAVQSDSVFVLWHSKGQLLFTVEAALTNGNLMANVPKINMPAGIHQIDAFDKRKQHIGTRLVFLAPSSVLKARVTPRKNNYNTRQLVNIGVQLQQGYTGMASVSVYQAPQNSSQYSANAYFWLNSELARPIDLADSYLNSIDKRSSKQQLDNELIANTPSRYPWQVVGSPAANQAPAFPVEASKLTIKGKINRVDNEKPMPNTRFSVSVPGVAAALLFGKSDAQGKFEIGVPPNFIEGELVFKAYGGAAAAFELSEVKAEKLTLNNDFIANNTMEVSESFEAGAKKQARIYKYFVQHNSAKATNRKTTIVSKRNSYGFYGKPDVRVDLRDYVEFPDMQDVTNEILDGTRFKNRKGQWRLTVYDIGTQNYDFLKENASVFVDGVPIQDLDEFASLPPNIVKNIDVRHGKYYIGSADTMLYGIVSVETFEGNYSNNAQRFFFNGIAQGWEFASTLEYTDERGQKRPDFRNTVYWQGSLPLVNDSTSTITFTHNDNLGKIFIDVQGISNTGVPFSGQGSYEAGLNAQ